MSQNISQGTCPCSSLTMLPVHGFGLAVDASALIAESTPVSGCREHVDHDVHIYIDGNRTESGDGLTPETAVKGYYEAVDALARYDSGNRHIAAFHFADLHDPDAVYPEITVHRSHYGTFAYLQLSGVSHQTTRVDTCRSQPGTHICIGNLCLTCMGTTKGWLALYGKVALKPRPEQKSYISAGYGGTIYFNDHTEVFLHTGEYYEAMCALGNSSIYNTGPVTFHTLGPVHFENAFAYAIAASCIRLTAQVDFSGCTSVTGRRYGLHELSCLRANGLTLPGSLAGTVANGSVYI